MDDVSQLGLDIEALRVQTDGHWMLLSGFGVFFMQVGFAMLEVGSVREQNTADILIKNVLDACVSALIWYAVGFGFAFAPGNSIWGNSLFFECPPELRVLKFYQWTFACAAQTIVAGAVAERCHFNTYIVYSIFVSGLMYPIVCHSVWNSNGWLANLNILGELTPFHDHAGACVVHMVGGCCSLVGAILIGPRFRRFKYINVQGSAKRVVDLAYPGQSPTMIVCGTLLLWFCWFFFNTGVHSDSTEAATVAMNSALGGAAGAVMGGVLCSVVGNGLEEDIVKVMNCLLSGLVSVTGSCDVIYSWAAIVTGATAAVVYFGCSMLLVRCGVDDPVDAVPVHLAAGTWGVFSIGLFHNSKGLFMDGGGYQLAAQLVGILSTIIYVGILGTVAFGGVILLQKKNICRFRRDFWQELAGFAPGLSEREREYRVNFEQRKKSFLNTSNHAIVQARTSALGSGLGSGAPSGGFGGVGGIAAGGGLMSGGMFGLDATNPRSPRSPLAPVEEVKTPASVSQHLEITLEREPSRIMIEREVSRVLLERDSLRMDRDSFRIMDRDSIRMSEPSRVYVTDSRFNALSPSHSIHAAFELGSPPVLHPSPRRVSVTDDHSIPPPLSSPRKNRRQHSHSFAEMARIVGFESGVKLVSPVDLGVVKQFLTEEDFGIQIASDLHMEMWSRQKFYPLQHLLEHVVEKAAPVLALLGDISVCGDAAGFAEYKKFVTYQAKQFSQVIILAGNHEFYCDPDCPVSVKAIKEDIQQFANSLRNVQFLDNNMIEINGVLVFGTTLWSEIDNFAANMIQRSVNDFEMIFVHDENNALRKLEVTDVIKWHKVCVAKLKEAARVARKEHKKLVVLSHHAPTFQGSSSAKDENSPIGSAFCTNLDVLMDYGGDSETSAIHTWAFGHTHHCSDQKINGVRVLSNQYGYTGVLNNDYNERCFFNVG